VTGFRQFNLKEDILLGIEAMRFETPTPIQEKVIPAIMSGRDVMATAQTGTGKTAAFVLPVLNHLLIKGADMGSIAALIIVPTRELALQIDQQLEGFSYFLNVSFISVYGGGDSLGWDKQKSALTAGVEIVTATPGRLLSHINLGYIDFSDLDFLILDEVDRMLDMGFYDDIMKIVDILPSERQNLMFSATIPPNIRKLAGKILVNPVFIDIEGSKPADNAVQAVYFLREEQKLGKIMEIFTGKDITGSIVFASSKLKVKKIASELKQKGMNVRAIHSDLEQREREEVMRDFRNRKIQILVATDVISRGIDVAGLDLIINFDVPADPEDYIHRVGRTARAHSSGVALTFVSPREKRDLYKIERFLGSTIYKIPD
jgi:superfamily II DNA/RNA helicase